MMKSFFKKLAFVMALAMVVSMAAPAATTASAAEEMKIGYQNGAVITELNLTEARSSEDLKAVGAPSNWKELGMTWTSSNPAVATVDNSGVVTAVAAGTADIMVICGDFTATIAVNCFANAEAYDVTIGTADERSITEKTLKVGEKFDFAFFGVKDYGRDKVNNAPRYFCEWDSTDTAVATVDKNGLVEAVAPGKAKITLIVWNLATGTKHNVAPCWVTVEAEEVVVTEPSMTVAQTAEDGLKLTFENIDVTKETLEAGLKAYYMINDTKVEHVVAIKEVKDGVAKVSSYANFVEGWTYVFEYEGMEASFEAYIGKPVKIVGSYKCDELDVANKAYTNYNTKISYKIYNEKGMDITKTAMAGTATVEISLVNDVIDGSFTLDTFNQKIYFTQAGKVANIKFDYYTGEVNDMGQRVLGATSVLPIVSEKEPEYTMVSVIEAKTDKNNGRTTLSVDELGAKANLIIKFKDTKGEVVDTSALTLPEHIGGHFTYKTTKDSVVSVDANGQLTPNAQGTANILVYYDYDLLDNKSGNVVAIVPITVIGNRVVTNFSVTQKSVSNVIACFDAGDARLANKDVTGLQFNQAEFTFWIADQLWEGKTPNKVTLTCNNQSRPAGVGLLTVSQWGNNFAYNGNTIEIPAAGWIDLVFTAEPGVLGNYAGYTYSYTLTADGKSTTFSITVKKPTYNATNNQVAVQGYALDVWGGNNKDIKVVSHDANVATAAFYEVSNGVHVGIVDVNPNNVTTYVPGQYYFSVSGLNHGALKVDGSTPYAAKENTVHGIEIPLTALDVNYEAWQLNGTATPGALNVPKFVNKNVNGTDTYSVSIYRAVNASNLQIVDQESIYVTDTQEKLVYTGKQQNYYEAATNANNINALVQKCFKFNFNGTDWTKANHYKNVNESVYFDVVYNVNNSANTSAGTFTPGEVYYINCVYFYVPVWNWDGNNSGTTYIQYIVPVNDYVVIK